MVLLLPKRLRNPRSPTLLTLLRRGMCTVAQSALAAVPSAWMHGRTAILFGDQGVSVGNIGMECDACPISGQSGRDRPSRPRVRSSVLCDDKRGILIRSSRHSLGRVEAPAAGTGLYPPRAWSGPSTRWIAGRRYGEWTTLGLVRRGGEGGGGGVGGGHPTRPRRRNSVGIRVAGRPPARLPRRIGSLPPASLALLRTLSARRVCPAATPHILC